MKIYFLEDESYFAPHDILVISLEKLESVLKIQGQLRIIKFRFAIRFCKQCYDYKAEA